MMMLRNQGQLRTNRRRDVRTVLCRACGLAASPSGRWHGLESLEGRRLLAATLMHEYLFDEGAGTTTQDLVGGNHGTLDPFVQWTTVKFGNALQFDGSAAVTTAFDLESILGGTASLSAWVKTPQSRPEPFWMAPGITGAEQGIGSNDIFWGYMTPWGGIAV